MQPIEKASQLFEEIKKGNMGVADEFFNTLWLNGTTMPKAEAKELVGNVYDWAKANSQKYHDFFAVATFTASWICYHTEKFDESIQYALEAQKVFEERNDEEGIAASHCMVGSAYRSMGDLEISLKYFLESAGALSKSKRFKLFDIVNLYQLGEIYNATNQPDKALPLFEQGLELENKFHFGFMTARFTNSIAGVYMKQKKYALALEYYQRSIDITDNSTELSLKARSLTDIGDYYCFMGDYAQAIRYNEEALAYRRQMNIFNGAITNMMNMGDIYRKQGRLQDAIAILEDALKQAEQLKVMLKVYQLHLTLSDIYLGMGDMPKSMYHYKAYHEIKEDVSHEDMDRRILNQQKIFEAEQTTKENAIIKAQKIEIEHKNAELQDTIDELTITKVSRRAKAITLFIAISLIVIEESFMHFVVNPFAHDDFFITLGAEGLIVLSLRPIEKAVEHYLLKKVALRRKRVLHIEA